MDAELLACETIELCTEASSIKRECTLRGRATELGKFVKGAVNANELRMVAFETFWRWCGLQSRRQSQQVQVDIFCATTVRVLGLVQYCAKWCKKAGEKRKAECEPGLDEVARYYPKALTWSGA